MSDGQVRWKPMPKRDVEKSALDILLYGCSVTEYNRIDGTVKRVDPTTVDKTEFKKRKKK